MGLGANINFDLLELRKEAHENAISFKYEITNYAHWFIFPFTVYTGFIPSTETGWKPNNAIPSDYSSYIRIFNGEESIIAQWKESTRIYQKGKGQEINLLTVNDFNNQPVPSGIIANRQVFFAIKNNYENGVGWQINTGEIIYKAEEMIKYTEIYNLIYYTADGTQDNFYTKEYKVGSYWDAYIADDTSNIDFSSLKSETIFTTQSTQRQYTLYITNINQQELIINDYFNFFVVFNDRGENIGGGNQNSRNQDRQFLYPSNVINYYSPLTGEFLFQQITFSSINDKLQDTGQSLIQFIQTSAPGEGYAFPTIKFNEETGKGDITVNEELIKDVGIKYAAFRLFGMGGIGACPIIGRPIIKGKFNERVQNSRFLLASNIFTTPPNKINTYSQPDTTWYNVLGVQPTVITGYKDWKADVEARYNFLSKKQNEGVIITDYTNTPLTNSSSPQPNNNDNNTNMFWSKTWKYQQPINLSINGKSIPNTMNTQTSRYFRKQINSAVNIGTQSINYNGLGIVNMWDYLNLNAFTFNQFTVLPLNETQKLVFSPFSIPGGVGKFLNIISFGIPWGWVINQDETLWPNFQFLNLFMSSSIYNFYNKIFWSESAAGKGYLPWEAFRDAGTDEVGAMIGANSSSMAFLIKLSDKVKGPTWNIDGSKGVSKVWSTYNLGQQNQNTNELYLWDIDQKIVDSDTALDTTELDPDLIYNQTEDGTEQSYIIDMFSLYSIFKGNIQVDFYNDNPFFYSEQQQTQLSVWQWKGKSQSSFTNNMRDWVVNYKTSYLLPHDFEQPTFNYPAYINPPTPFKFDDYIIPSVFIENQILNDINQDLPDAILITSFIWKAVPSTKINWNNTIIQVAEIKFSDLPNGQFLTNWNLFVSAYDKISILSDINNFISTDVIKGGAVNEWMNLSGSRTVDTVQTFDFTLTSSQGSFLVKKQFDTTNLNTLSFGVNWTEIINIPLQLTPSSIELPNLFRGWIENISISLMGKHTDTSIFIGFKVATGNIRTDVHGAGNVNTAYTNLKFITRLLASIKLNNWKLISRK